jgi:hypothetical protein
MLWVAFLEKTKNEENTIRMIKSLKMIFIKVTNNRFIDRTFIKNLNKYILKEK